MKFVIGCCHFDDDTILPYRRLCSVEEMNFLLEENWKRVVSADDEVYILGDFALKRPSYWSERLPGKKTLILGNHDSFMVKDSGFAGVHETALVRVRRGRGTVAVWMSHYPFMSWPERQEGSVHLHAHCHGTVPASLPGVYGPARLDMSAEVWGYTPVELERAIALAEARQRIKTEKKNG